jgi:hypothetical protein
MITPLLDFVTLSWLATGLQHHHIDLRRGSPHGVSPSPSACIIYFIRLPLDTQRDFDITAHVAANSFCSFLRRFRHPLAEEEESTRPRETTSRSSRPALHRTYHQGTEERGVEDFCPVEC